MLVQQFAALAVVQVVGVALIRGADTENEVGDVSRFGGVVVDNEILVALVGAQAVLGQAAAVIEFLDDDLLADNLEQVDGEAVG